MPLMGNVVISKKNPTHTQDHGDAWQREGRVLSTYPRRPKAEAFINAVDVIVHLHDLSRSSTERTAPPHSAHVQLDDVLAFLIQQEGRSSR